MSISLIFLTLFISNPFLDSTLEQTLEHLRLVVDAVDVPVNVDFEGGFAVDPGAGQRERDPRRGHGGRRSR